MKTSAPFRGPVYAIGGGPAVATKKKRTIAVDEVEKYIAQRDEVGDLLLQVREGIFMILHEAANKCLGFLHFHGKGIIMIPCQM